MKVKFFCCLFIILSTLIYMAVQANEVDEFTIAGLHLGLNGEEVIKILGIPTKKERSSSVSIVDPAIMVYRDIWFYEGIILEFCTGVKQKAQIPKYPSSLDIIRIESEKYQTCRGIKIGDSIKKLLAIYNEIDTKQAIDDRYFYSKDFYTIVFVVADNKVKEIWICDEGF